MVTLVIVGLLGGLITSISPCILPVLPIVLTAGLTSTPEPPESEGAVAVATRTRLRRPLTIVAGLVASFSATTLFGSWFLSSVGLPQDFLRNLGIGVLIVLGLGLLIPWVGELLQRPFTRLRAPTVDPSGSGIVLGLGLGLVFAPCAGPVLATIAVVGATHDFGLQAVVLTLAFAVGAAIPLLGVAVAGERITTRVAALRASAPRLRQVGGVVMIVIAVAIAASWTDPLQRNVPGYTSSLQQHIENNSLVRDDLRDLVDGNSPDDAPGNVAVSDDLPEVPSSVPCREAAAVLVNCGPAPELAGISDWLGSGPLTLAGLRGKVVLIDFWTYSCINCQRTLPYLEAWYRQYHEAGLEIIGVHAPEFAFEHVVSNVESAARKLGVQYPIAIDNDFDTWNTYGNRYWPAKYLVDASGEVRHVKFGEGDYGITESLIRELLADASPTRTLAASTDLPDDSARGPGQTRETYLGYLRARANSGAPLVHDVAHEYPAPAGVYADTFALAGTWTAGPEAITAGPDAELQLNYAARRVFLVLGGTGTVRVTVNGTTSVVRVRGEPTLYPLIDAPQMQRAMLSLQPSPGIEAYAFTFG